MKTFEDLKFGKNMIKGLFAKIKFHNGNEIIVIQTQESILKKSDAYEYRNANGIKYDVPSDEVTEFMKKEQEVQMENAIIKFDKDSFWHGAYPEGATREQIMNELNDYTGMMDEVGKLYWELTGGILSKPNTACEHIMTYYNERMDAIYDEAVADYKEEQDDNDK
mgnify:FL=1